MKKHAFTLSEVLIALTIIGVIAALTVPTLMQNTQKQEYVSALKKAYSTLSQATNMIIAEHGSPKADENGESWAASSKSIYDMYIKYLKNARECGSGAECWYNSGIKTLKSSRPESNGRNISSSYYKVLMQDGVLLFFEYKDKQCSHSEPYNGTYNICGWIYADVNGAANPNTFGRDVFVFVLKEDGLYPAGCRYENSDCGASNESFACACKVLRENAMNY